MRAPSNNPATANRLPTMRLLILILAGLAAGYALATFLDPAFPSIIEIIDNPKY